MGGAVARRLNLGLYLGFLLIYGVGLLANLEGAIRYGGESLRLQIVWGVVFVWSAVIVRGLLRRRGWAQWLIWVDLMAAVALDYWLLRISKPLLLFVLPQGYVPMVLELRFSSDLASPFFGPHLIRGILWAQIAVFLADAVFLVPRLSRPASR